MKTGSRQAEIHVGEITVISGVRLRGRTVDQYAHGRRSHGIVFVRSGEACFTHDGTQMVVRDRQLLHIPKGFRYIMQYTASETSFVTVNFELTEGLLPSKQLFLLDCANEAEAYDTIFHALERCSESGSLPDLLRRKEWLYRLLAAVLESGALQPDAAPSPQIAPGVQLLEQTYLQNLPIARFAQACSMSLSAFRAQFTAELGLSPIQYRNHLRIARAASLLEDGSCTVTEAAYASGFENLGYFCRCYQKHTGQKPSAAKKTAPS